MTIRAEATLVIPPDALSLRRIGGWLRATTDLVEGDAGHDLATRAELAAHEACMNVIDHAQPPPGSVIELRLELRDDALVVRVRDEGDPFDLDAVAEPAAHVLQERGFGVKIIRSLVDGLASRRVGGTNELELELRIDRGTRDA